MFTTLRVVIFNGSTIMMKTKWCFYTMFPNWTDTWKMQLTVVWLEMAGWALWHCDHRQQSRAIEHEGQGGTDRNRMTVHVGMVCWAPLFVFVCNRQPNQNVSAHCNSGRLHLRSPMGHLRLYIYGRHDEAPKQRNMRLGWGWDKGVRERKGGEMRF